MTVFISTEEGELVNLDHIEVISPTEVNSAGKQRLEAKTYDVSSGYRLFTGTPAEVEDFRRRISGLIRRSGGVVIDTLQAAERISNAKLDEQERTAPVKHQFDEGFFETGKL